MFRRTRRFTLGLGIGAALLSVNSAQAWTATGYVCVVSLTPSKSILGSSGFLSLEICSGPAGDNEITHAYVCSIGATSSSDCDLSTTAYGPKYLLSEPQLLALYKSLVEAAAKNLKVIITQTSAGYRFQGIVILPSD
jgi:hypothetical protein